MKCSRCGKERYAFPKICGECVEWNGTSWISVKDRLPENGWHLHRLRPAAQRESVDTHSWIQKSVVVMVRVARSLL